MGEGKASFQLNLEGVDSGKRKPFLEETRCYLKASA